MPGKYLNSTSDLKSVQKETIIGHLSLGVTNHQLLSQQRVSWTNQIDYLKSHLDNLDDYWVLIFEYPIPRRSKMIDILGFAKDFIVALA